VTEGDWLVKYNNLAKTLGVDCLIDSLGSGDVLSILIKGLPLKSLVLLIGMLNGTQTMVDMKTSKKMEVNGYTMLPWHLPSWLPSVPFDSMKKLVQVHS